LELNITSQVVLNEWERLRNLFFSSVKRVHVFSQPPDMCETRLVSTY